MGPGQGEGAEDAGFLEAGKFEQRWGMPVRQSSKKAMGCPPTPLLGPGGQGEQCGLSF